VIKLRLGDVATVRSGLVLSRKQARGTTKHRYKVLNLSSVNPDGYIDIKKTDPYNAIEPLNREYLSQAGDVVIRLSKPYTAVLIDKNTSGMVISSNFAIIRPDPSRILPEYLYWLLNTPKINRLIFENTTSNMLGAIKPRYFADFEVDSLSIENQEKIAELNRLAQREYRLLNKLAEAKEKYYSRAIIKIQKQMKRGNSHDDKK
jgi:restriction endonuclease S subunit